MKKEKKEISVNLSSGAEKVERISRRKKADGAESVQEVITEMNTEPITAQGDAALGSAEEVKKKIERKVEKESEAAKARVEAALKKKEEKARKAKEKQERAEKAKKEREESQRARAHAKANRRQDREHARAKRRAERGDKDRKSYGGWLAAVIALSAVTLALGTTVAVGAMEMKSIKEGTISSYRATMYELTEVMEHVDDDLDRVRVSASPVQQSRILTDLLVQTRMAEMDLERLPICAEKDCNVTTFLNSTAATCERLLAKLRSGESLSQSDIEKLEGIYATYHKIRDEMNAYVGKMQDADLTSYLKKGEGAFADAIAKWEEMTLEENRIDRKRDKTEMDGAGMRSMDENEENKIDPAQAETLCMQYFSDYHVDRFQCVGETVTRGYKAYNVQGYDKNGTLLFAELDQKNGALLRFDFYEDCNTDTFDRENAQRIAEEFLTKMGYFDLQAVRVRENGTTADFTFVYEKDGVVYYPDEVRVKVCRSRGIVSGMDASKFLYHHKQDRAPAFALSLEEVQNKLSEKLTVEHARPAVIQVGRYERSAYEFLCSYGEEKYVVYLSAKTGEEIAIVNVNALR